MFVVYCVCWLIVIVCCPLVDGNLLWFVVFWVGCAASLCDESCLLLVVCRLMRVVCCLLIAVCCVV